MSYSTSIVLPHLLKNAKAIEDMYNKYGSSIYYNPADDKSVGLKPSVAINAAFMTNVADNLVKYYQAKQSMGSQLQSKKNTATFYFALMLILVVVPLLAVIVVMGYKLFNEVAKDGNEVKNAVRWLDKIVQGILMIVVVLITVYIILLSVQIYKKNNTIYSKMYANPVETDQIAQLVSMFDIKSWNTDNGEMKVDTTSPLLVYTYARNRPKLTITLSDPKKYPNAGCQRFKGKNKVGLSEKEVIQECEPLNQKGLVYPFVSKSDTLSTQIRPVELRKQLQSLDLYGQQARIRAASLYFKKLMFMEYDDKFKGGGKQISAQMKLDILNRIVHILYGDFAVISDIVIDVKKANAIKCSKFECYSSCLSDENAVMAYYDDASRTGYIVTHDVIVAGIDISVPSRSQGNQGSQGMELLVKSSNLVIPLSGTSPNTDYIYSNFKSSPEACKRDSKHCLMNKNKSNPLVAPADATDYKKVFSGNPDGVAVVYNESLENIVKINRELSNYGLLLTQLRAYFIDEIITQVITGDTTRTFTLEQSDIVFVLEKVIEKMGDVEGPKYKSILNDILTAVPPELTKVYLRQEKADSIRFIPFDRFKEKIADMTSQDFVINFVYNAEELRASSKGLQMLNDVYNYKKTEEDAKMYIFSITIVFSMLIGLLCLAAYIINDVKQYNCDQTIQDFTKLHKEDNKKREASQKIWSYIVEKYIIKYVFILSFFTIVYFMLYGMKAKKESVYKYNQDIMETNSDIIVTNSSQVMELLYQDMIKDKFGISKPTEDLSYTKNRALKKANITIDPLASLNDLQKQENADWEYFDVIVKNASVNSEIKLSVSEDSSLYEMYLKMMQMVSAYDKCNALFAMDDIKVPLPIMELTVYVVMLIISFVTILYVLSNFKPFEQFKNVVFLRKIMRRLKMGQQVSPIDVNDLSGMSTADNMNAMTMVKIIAAMLVVVFTVVFCTTIKSNGDQFISNLYGGQLYVNSECYKL